MRREDVVEGLAQPGPEHQEGEDVRRDEGVDVKLDGLNGRPASQAGDREDVDADAKRGGGAGAAQRMLRPERAERRRALEQTEEVLEPYLDEGRSPRVGVVGRQLPERRVGACTGRRGEVAGEK